MVKGLEFSSLSTAGYHGNGLKKPFKKAVLLYDFNVKISFRDTGDVVKENNSSQSGSVPTNNPDQVVNNEDKITDKPASARKLEMLL